MRCPQCKAGGSDVHWAGFVVQRSETRTSIVTRRATNRTLGGVAQSYSEVPVPYTYTHQFGYWPGSCAKCGHEWKTPDDGDSTELRPPTSWGDLGGFGKFVLGVGGLWFLSTILGVFNPFHSRSGSGSGSAEPVPVSAPDASRVAFGSTVCRLHSSPALDAEVVGRTKAGVSYRVLDKQDDYWYRIQVGKVTGWAACRPAPQ